MKRANVFLGVILLLLAGCGDDNDVSDVTVESTTVESAVAEPATTAAPVTQPAITAAPVTEPATAAPAPDPVVLMPDVVCMNLQDAQDKIQDAGVFFSRSDDASGQGRSQIMDRNWVVVAQDPAPGSPIGELEAVLSVVKTDEANSC